MKGPYWSLLLCIALNVQSTTSQESKKIWIIAIGDDWGAHEYRDEQGFLRGFGPDFIDTVCLESNLDCRMVLAPYTDCFVSGAGTHPYGGDGLMGRWFDACSSWVPTVERIHVFSFTMPYMKTQNSYFFYLKDKSFDPTNLAGKKIGFITGWASNEQCVARQNNIANNILDTTQIIHKDRVSDIIDALKSGEIDAALAVEATWTSDHAQEIRKAESRELKCLLDGTGLMARKDSEFLLAWNTAFTKFKNFGRRYNKFCNDTNAKHSAKGVGTDCLE